MQASVSAFCPYKGLVPYAEEDARFFFGRAADQQIITANLFASHLTILYGASGVGKSSLLQAGVRHALHQTPGRAAVIFNRWQTDPLAGLKQAVAEEVERVTAPTPASRPGPAFDRDGSTLDQYLARQASGLSGPLMIILDQFEEFFLYPPATDDSSQSFAAQFARAVNLDDCPVSFLVALREDALAKLDRFERRIPGLFDNYLRVEHLGQAAAREAITRPLAVYNVDLPPARQVAIEDDLVGAIVAGVQTGKVLIGQVGGGKAAGQKGNDDGWADTRIEAPYLQLVLTRLWNEERKRNSRTLRLETLTRLGGADRIVRTHLDEQLAMLKPRQQEVAAEIFHYLVTPSGTKIGQKLDDLAGYAELRPEVVRPVVDLLAAPERRVLRAVAAPWDEQAAQPDAGDDQEIRYEIFHDVLAQAVLDWRARYLTRAPIAIGSVVLLIASLVIAVLATRFKGALPVAIVVVARGAALLVFQTVILKQVYRFFARSARLLSGRLPVSGTGSANLGMVLSVLLAALWYAATAWPAGMLKGLAATTTIDYVGYFVGTGLFTLGLALIVFLAMSSVGRLTFWLCKRFDVGFYGTYVVVCIVIVVLTLWQATADPALKWLGPS